MSDEKTAKNPPPSVWRGPDFLEKKAGFAAHSAEKSPLGHDLERAELLNDLRSAAGAVAAIAELFGGTALEPEQRELLETLRFGTKNLTALAAHFSAFETEKSPASTVEKSPEPFDLLELLDAFEKAFSARARGRSVRVEAAANLPEGERFFIGDEAGLRRILTNLMENALVFTEKGSIQLAVRRDAMIAVGTAPMLLFEVTDTGAGIPADEIGRIFEPFFRGKQAEKLVPNSPRGGQGRGLALVRELAERLGGSVAAQSKPGKGARLQVRLPLELADAAAGAAFSAENAAKKAAHASALRRSTVAGRTVLAIDDDALSRRMLGHMLESWGCRYVLAATAARGLEMAESHRFDLVFLASGLADGAVLTVAEAVRTGAASLNHHAPLIGFGGNGAERGAFDLFLEKPVLPSVALAAMHFLLTQKPGFSADAEAKSDLAEQPMAEPFAVELEADGSPDFSALLEFCGQNGLFAAEMLALCLREAPERAANLVAAAERGQLEEARKWSHALKSDFWLMGLPELRQLALELEAEAKSPEPDAANALFLAKNVAERLRRALPSVEAARAEFLAAAG